MKSFLRLTAGVAVATMMTVSGAQAAKQCASPEDIRAIQSKSLQTELMVAALACNYMGRYNEFMTRYQGDLQANGVVLKRFFQKNYGKSGAKELDHFVTELANVASQKNNRGTGAFCQTAEVNFNMMLSAAEKGLNDYASAQPLDRQLGIVPCQ